MNPVPTDTPLPVPPPDDSTAPLKVALFVFVLAAAAAALFAVPLTARYEMLTEWRFRLEGSNVEVAALGPASLEHATYLAAAPDGDWLAEIEGLPSGSAAAPMVDPLRRQVRGERLAERLAGRRPHSAQTHLRATELRSGVTLDIWAESTLTRGFGDRLRVSTANLHPKALATLTTPFGRNPITIPAPPPADTAARRAAAPGPTVRWYHPGGPMREPLTVWRLLSRPNGPAALTACAQQSIEEQGLWGPVWFIAAYVVGAVIVFPATILTIGGALAFGFWGGLAYVTLAANLGASAAFAIGRFVARDAVERLLPARLRTLDAKLEARGLVTVLFLRFLPLFPFNVTNYVCGLSRVRYRDFLVGTAIGALPATVLWVSVPLVTASPWLKNPFAWAPLAALLLYFPVSRLIGRLRRQKAAPNVP